MRVRNAVLYLRKPVQTGNENGKGALVDHLIVSPYDGGHLINSIGPITHVGIPSESGSIGRHTRNEAKIIIERGGGVEHCDRA